MSKSISIAHFFQERTEGYCWNSARLCQKGIKNTDHKRIITGLAIISQPKELNEPPLCKATSVSTCALQFLNIFFLIFHTLIIVFNCFGWVLRKTRKWNLMTLGVTAFSWLVMGIWKGVGYCICTDWHWQVRRALGLRTTESSYLDFLVKALSGWTPDPNLTRSVAGLVFGTSFVLSVALNLRDSRQNQKQNIRRNREDSNDLRAEM